MLVRRTVQKKTDTFQNQMKYKMASLFICDKSPTRQREVMAIVPQSWSRFGGFSDGLKPTTNDASTKEKLELSAISLRGLGAPHDKLWYDTRVESYSVQ